MEVAGKPSHPEPGGAVVNIRKTTALCFLAWCAGALIGIAPVVIAEQPSKAMSADEAQSRATDAAKRARDAAKQAVQAADDAAHVAAQEEAQRTSKALVDAAHRAEAAAKHAEEEADNASRQATEANQGTGGAHVAGSEEICRRCKTSR